MHSTQGGVVKTAIYFIALALLSNSAFAASDINAAKTAALKWLGELDAGHYAATWTEASTLFQQRVPKAEWINAASQVMSSLGKLETRNFKRAIRKQHLPGAPNGDYIVIQFSSSFEHKPDAIETVTPMLSGGKWKVSGYYVR